MVRVGQEDQYASVLRAKQGVAKSNLIVPAEQLFVVFDEAVVLMTHRVWRIGKHNITCNRRVYLNFKVRTNDACGLQQLGHGSEIIGIKLTATSHEHSKEIVMVSAT